MLYSSMLVLPRTLCSAQPKVPRRYNRVISLMGKWRVTASLSLAAAGLVWMDAHSATNRPAVPEPSLSTASSVSPLGQFVSSTLGFPLLESPGNFLHRNWVPLRVSVISWQSGEAALLQLGNLNSGLGCAPGPWLLSVKHGHRARWLCNSLHFGNSIHRE